MVSDDQKDRRVNIVVLSDGSNDPHLDCPACHKGATKVKKHKTWNERYCTVCGFKRAEKK